MPMKANSQTESEIQGQYYADKAREYEGMHVHDKGAHSIALSFLLSVLDYFEIQSILIFEAHCGNP